MAKVIEFPKDRPPVAGKTATIREGDEGNPFAGLGLDVSNSFRMDSAGVTVVGIGRNGGAHETFPATADARKRTGWMNTRDDGSAALQRKAA